MRDAIVIGASAGGISALRKLVGGFPPDLPAAVLTVLHIPADAPSSLPLLLSGAGELPAKSAEQGEPLHRGTIYVAPPAQHLLVERGRIRLTRGPRENRSRPSVDTLFRSAAVDFGPRVIGVVLSGALDDGTAGLWAVKDRGGLAVVQEPTEADFPDMPSNAIAHVAVDHVLPVAEMGRKLAALAAEPVPPMAAVPRAMAAEVELELNGPSSPGAVLGLGVQSPNACPDCHGSLVEIRDGPIVRFRCHTGHAYSLRSLLADTEESIEKSLWSTLRSIDERSFLLRTLEQRAREAGDMRLADRLASDAARDEEKAKQVRELTVGPKIVPRQPARTGSDLP